jgi:hypothetical protein
LLRQSRARNSTRTRFELWLTFEMAPSKLRLGSHPYDCQSAERTNSGMSSISDHGEAGNKYGEHTYTSDESSGVCMCWHGSDVCSPRTQHMEFRHAMAFALLGGNAHAKGGHGNVKHGSASKLPRRRGNGRGWSASIMGPVPALAGPCFSRNNSPKRGDWWLGP